MAIELQKLDRQKWKVELWMELGALLAPLFDLHREPGRFSGPARSRMLSRFAAEALEFQNRVHSYAMGDPAACYAFEFQQFSFHLSRLVSNAPFRPDIAGQLAAEVVGDIRDALSAIPVEQDYPIQDAYTPFSTYCRLKDITAAAVRRLTIFDAYVGDALFHRLLRDVPASAVVTLVTMEPHANANPKDRRRWSDFMDVSRLYAVERGPQQYRLVKVQKIHDRWLLADEQLYHLGGSLKDAGWNAPYTIGRMELTPANLQAIDDEIAGGIELFGPAVSTHA